MSTLDRDDAPERTLVLCDGCRRPAECEIWTHPVCYACHGDWHERAPSVGEIEAKYLGIETYAAMCIAYPLFTKEWLKRRRVETNPLKLVNPDTETTQP